MPIVSSGTDVIQYCKAKAFKSMSYEKENKLFYGVELELEVPRGTKRVDGSYLAAAQVEPIVAKAMDGYAICKYEGSISNGLELVTVPATLDVHRCLLWDEVFKQTKGMLHGSKNTGMHIHFSRNALTAQQLAKVIYFIHETSNSKFVNKVAGRNSQCWAATSSKKKFMDYSDPNIGDRNTEALLKEETYTRSAISISGRFRGKSVEVRIFQAIAKKEAVVSGLEFLDSLIKYAENCSNTEKALSYEMYLEWFKTKRMKDMYPTYNDNLMDLGILEKPLRGVACLFPAMKLKKRKIV